MSFKNVLIPVDNSENADHALNYFLTNMYREGQQVTVFYVMEPPQLPVFSMGTPCNLPVDEWTHLMAEHNKKLEAIQEKYEKILRDAKVPLVKYMVSSEATTDVGHAIVKFAKNNKYEMIVMGSRGLNTVRRTFLGSVSDYTLHHFGGPILVIPPLKS